MAGGSSVADQSIPGSQQVAAHLDIFNLRYQRLCEALREKLERLGEQSDDPDIKE